MQIQHTAIDRTPYTYLIKFKPTGQVYYGSRTGVGCHPDELFNVAYGKKAYNTSSKLVKVLLTNYGTDAFEWEIRKVFNNKETCILWESKVLAKFNVETNPNFLNCDSKQQSFLAIQNRIKTKFISDPINKICIRVHLDFPIPAGWILGNINCMNRPSANKGTTWYHNPETQEHRMLFPNDEVPAGFIRNRSLEYLKSHSEKLKRNINITNGKENRMIRKEARIPDGWRRGKTFANKPNGKRRHIYVWITDGNISKQHIKDQEIPIGFYLGLTKKRRS